MTEGMRLRVSRECSRWLLIREAAVGIALRLYRLQISSQFARGHILDLAVLDDQ